MTRPRCAPTTCCWWAWTPIRSTRCSSRATSRTAVGSVDGCVALPEEQELVVRRALEAIEEEQKMAYVTSFERSYPAEGMLDGQRVTLLRVIRALFGVVPDTLEKRIATADQETLDQLTDRASTAASLD